MARHEHSREPAARAHDPARPAGRSIPFQLLRSLRPEQWTKNLFVFAGLGFGLKLFEPEAVLRASAAALIFCVLSGVVTWSTT